jgi:hypothetical protein
VALERDRALTAARRVTDAAWFAHVQDHAGSAELVILERDDGELHVRRIDLEGGALEAAFDLRGTAPGDRTLEAPGDGTRDGDVRRGAIHG